MKRGDPEFGCEDGVAVLIDYIIVTGVLMALMFVMILLVNTTILQGPADRLTYVAFTDIGNGVSTRIVEVYAIAPGNGTIVSRFNLPADVAGRDYFVEVGTRQSPINPLVNDSQFITISEGAFSTSVDLSGIGTSRGVTGNTTGKGINKITYDSRGV
jgi:hypothetical protein